MSPNEAQVKADQDDLVERLRAAALWPWGWLDGTQVEMVKVANQLFMDAATEISVLRAEQNAKERS